MAIKKQTKTQKTVTKKIVKATKSDLVQDLKKKLPSVNPLFAGKVVTIILLGLALFMLAKKYKGLVIAGIVNKSPITRVQLNQMLVKRYGKAVFDEMVSSELIKQEAKKQKITVLAEEISAELKTLEDRLGGPTELQNALTQYGMTKAELEEQIKLSLLQKKIVASQGNFEVSDTEAQEYFKANAASFGKQKFEEVKAEIVSLLKEQKMQEAFSKWFAELKAKAQIQSYLD